MKQFIKSISKSQLGKVLFLMVVLLSVTAIASYAHAPRGLNDADTPIDGGISVLLATGVGIGVKKVREMRKQKKEKMADSNKD